MKTEFDTPARLIATPVVGRVTEVNELTRAILAGKPVLVPAERPHILARRNARWARRATHA